MMKLAAKNVGPFVMLALVLGEVASGALVLLYVWVRCATSG